MSTLQQIGTDIWLQRHPLKLLGCELGRRVTVLRLPSGKLVIHSTAPFSPEDVDAIRSLGEPGWILDATNFHDTYCRAGRDAFPDCVYLVPPGFPGQTDSPRLEILPVPEEWEDQILVLELRGMPSIREHAFLHRPSRTLILADLLFHLPPSAGRWTHGVLRCLSGIDVHPGVSRLFRHHIKNKAAFHDSLRELLQLDFEQIVVAHGDPILSEAKSTLIEALHHYRLAPPDH